MIILQPSTSPFFAVPEVMSNVAIGERLRYIQQVILSLIVAASDNNVIGKGNDLPWHLPAELQYFRTTTSGKPVIMGRKTYESIQARGRAPLPGRRNIVISRSPEVKFEGADVVDSVDAAIAAAFKDKPEEAFVIGGAQIYEAALPKADRLYLTRVHTDVQGGDVFLPPFSPDEWEEKSHVDHPADDKNAIPFTISMYERKK